jgi:hypothetical protein
MIKIKEEVRVKPVIPTFSAIIILYLILAFFDPTNSLTMLAFFIFMSLFSSALSVIIYNLSPLIISFSNRLVNILHSFIIIMFAAISMYYTTQKPFFIKEVINNLIILTLIIIGCSYIVFGLINTGFPKFFRQLNILTGFVSILLSLITIAVSILGYLFLIVILCTLMALNRILEEIY